MRELFLLKNKVFVQFVNCKLKTLRKQDNRQELNTGCIARLR